jgi:hypothetical protein
MRLCLGMKGVRVGLQDLRRTLWALPCTTKFIVRVDVLHYMI